MAKVQIKTTSKVVPMIYAYTTPEIKRHDGWTKIGYTEQGVGKRIGQQGKTVDVEQKEEWRGTAVYDDGSGEVFTDNDFFRYLKKLKIERKPKTEWFHVSGPESRLMFNDFRTNRGFPDQINPVVPYVLRTEQAKAVSDTQDYMNLHTGTEVLWNAKPRFGKTLSVYDFCKQVDAKLVLIVTNRPAIANSWYEDYEKFLGRESGYVFVSNVDALDNAPLVVKGEDYPEFLLSHNDEDFPGKIQFVSLQDLKGSKWFGDNDIDKLKEVADLNWDVLIIDEAHEGIDTKKTEIAFTRIKRKFTIHLSGTPFKALANDKFPQEAIVNWTYADEQKAKRDWDYNNGPNPYENLPELSLFTYKMSDMIKDEVSKGVDVNGENKKYFFGLNEFFETKNGKFVLDSFVDDFLTALTTQEKYPFSTEELRNEIKHSFWLLNRVDSAKALAKKLNDHPVFKEYKVIIAAGDGKAEEESKDAEILKKSFDKVKNAIRNNDKTITLSVGQLTTGVTIPEWTAVLMLSDVTSPSLYMQAAFRRQNPCLFHNGTSYFRKERAYIFDFAPERSLDIYEQFANDLATETVNGKGHIEKRKKNIRELMNFFPVIGEDDEGVMVELDAEKVLSIPRRIKAKDVVRRGFMHNYLFQNVSRVFGSSSEIYDIINSFDAVGKGTTDNVEKESFDNSTVDEDGNVTLNEDYVEQQAEELFGDRIYDIQKDIEESLTEAEEEVKEERKEKDKLLEAREKIFSENAIKPMLETATEKYGELKSSDKKKLESKITGKAKRTVDALVNNYTFDKKDLDRQREEAVAAHPDNVDVINQEYNKRVASLETSFHESLIESASEFIKDAAKDIVDEVATKKEQEKVNSLVDEIHSHLRGFARTIPSFLMAYGTEEVTLANFDAIIPDNVFKDVTSISIEQFRLLRDGGETVDKVTGEVKHFEGHLFDEVVFDDSIKEFLAKKKELANYFEEGKKEDIFNYIPAQRTNQIFTPKKVVKQMVDMLEQENPECFDDPYKTFIDLYMKSGMYITEIVKRLYNSETMKEFFPDEQERLRHIFENQVYGLAPTEIIYRIAISYILGFSDTIRIDKHNFRMVDALPLVQNGTLEEYLDEQFGE